MRRNLFIALLIISLFVPTTSHAFGVLRWAWDGISNQLGLDRGPIPKVIPKFCDPRYDPRDNRNPLTQRVPFFYIQADGF